MTNVWTETTQIFNNLTVSGNNWYVSQPIDMKAVGLDLCLHGVIGSGPCTGTMGMIGSNDYSPITGLGDFLTISGLSGMNLNVLPVMVGSLRGTDGNTSPVARQPLAGTSDGVTVAVAGNGSDGNFTYAAVPGTITSATYHFFNAGVQPGDFAVIAAGSDKGTYRVSSVPSDSMLIVAAPSGFVGTTGNTLNVYNGQYGNFTSTQGNSFITHGVEPGMQVTLVGATNDNGVFPVLGVPTVSGLYVSYTPANPGPFVGNSSIQWQIPQQFTLQLTNPGCRFYKLYANITSGSGLMSVYAHGKG